MGDGHGKYWGDIALAACVYTQHVSIENLGWIIWTERLTPSA